MYIKQHDNPPPEYFQIIKEENDRVFGDWRADTVMSGVHPFNVELKKQKYVKIYIHTIVIDDGTSDRFSSPEYNNKYGSAIHESQMRFIEEALHDPKIQWAIDNSFDGLYVIRDKDMSTLGTNFKLFVYIKEELATFWKLRF